jgi:putative ABC transport system permease protein
MPFDIVLRVALSALRRNLLRTLLTMLGMIIGVGAVITMVALGSGAQASIEAQIMSAGTNLIMVNAGNWSSGGVRMGMGASSRLTSDDADAIRRTVGGIRYVSPSVRTREQVIFGGQNWRTQIEGTGVEFPLMRSWPLEAGAFFSQRHVDAAEKVAVLGSVVRETIFGPGVNPVGEVIRIGRQPFTVVGLLTSKGQGSGGNDQDDTIFVPYTTAQKKLMGVTHVNTITVAASSNDQVARIVADLTALMRVRHGLGQDDEDDFRIRTLEEIASVRSATTQTMSTLLACIAGVSLLVGGIGIMNIMLVSVTERTREIGIRVAIGARRRDVLLQFLTEAILISLAGGLIGVGVGFGVAKTLTAMTSWPTEVSSSAVLISFAFAGAIGVFFGWYPARKAAALDPIDALRFE